MTDANSANPDEVVSHARVQRITLPDGAGVMALITIDNDRDHTRPTTFGPAGLASLDAALDSVAAMTDISAVGVTGKPFIFAVGADLSAIGLVFVHAMPSVDVLAVGMVSLRGAQLAPCHLYSFEWRLQLQRSAP